MRAHVSLASCAGCPRRRLGLPPDMDPTPMSWIFEAIGTRWEVVTDEPFPASSREAVQAFIDGFDREWSRFRSDSVVSALAAAGGSVPAPRDATLMLDAFAALGAATDGAVNPLV